MVQLQMIDKVSSLALADDNISAVLMYGSFTQGSGDDYSDIEFYVFLHESVEIDKMEWLSKIRPVEMLYTNEFGTDVAVFDNLIRGEFHFHSVTEIGVISTWQGILDFSVRNKMKLVDKDGLLAEVLNNIEIISPEWNRLDNTAWVADSMINNLVFVGNVIRRGEYARAAHLFFFLEKYLASLIRLQSNSTEHWLDPMKGFEKEIPAEWYEKYKTCIPELNETSLKVCFRNTLELTKELFRLLDVPQHNKALLSKIIL